MNRFASGGRQNRRAQRRERDEAAFDASRPFLMFAVVLYMAAHVWAGSYPIVGRNALWGMQTTSLMTIALAGTLVVCGCEMLWLRSKFGRFMSCTYTILLLLTTGFMAWLVLTQIFIALNGALDTGAARTFRAHVLDKRASHYKSQVSYFLVLRDWKDARSAVEANVSELRFNQAKVGEQIEVETKSGALGIEWMVRIS